MSLRDALNKITARHPDVLGVMVRLDGDVTHTLESPYDMLPVSTIMENFADMLEQLEMLAEDGHPFTDILLDYDNHSVVLRALDHGVLAILTPRLHRSQLVKLQVGLGLFGKAITKAYQETKTAAPQQTPEPAPTIQAVPHVAGGKVDPVLMANLNEVAKANETEIEAEPVSTSGRLRPPSARRAGIMDRFAKRREEQPAEDATTEATAKEEPQTDADGVPLRTDGTPMKRRMYRGAVYYE